MVTPTGWLYLAGGTLLFFFWAYGIVSFALDVKNRVLPAIRRIRRGQTAQPDQDQHAETHESGEQQLY